MKIQLFACSESAALDMQSSRISLFHLTDVMVVAQCPFIIPSISIAAVARSEKQDTVECEIAVYNNDHKLANISCNFSFGEIGVCRNVTSIQNLVIPFPNDILFSLRSKGADISISEWRVKVSLLSETKSLPTARFLAEVPEMSMTLPNNPGKNKPKGGRPKRSASDNT